MSCFGELPRTGLEYLVELDGIFGRRHLDLDTDEGLLVGSIYGEE